MANGMRFVQACAHCLLQRPIGYTMQHATRNRQRATRNRQRGTNAPTQTRVKRDELRAAGPALARSAWGHTHTHTHAHTHARTRTHARTQTQTQTQTPHPPHSHLRMRTRWRLRYRALRSPARAGRPAAWRARPSRPSRAARPSRESAAQCRNDRRQTPVGSDCAVVNGPPRGHAVRWVRHAGKSEPLLPLSVPLLPLSVRSLPLSVPR